MEAVLEAVLGAVLELVLEVKKVEAGLKVKLKIVRS